MQQKTYKKDSRNVSSRRMRTSSRAEAGRCSEHGERAVVGKIAVKPKLIEFDTSCFTFADDENPLALSPHALEKGVALELPKMSASKLQVTTKVIVDSPHSARISKEAIDMGVQASRNTVNMRESLTDKVDTCSNEEPPGL